MTVDAIQDHMEASDAVTYAVSDVEDVSPLELTPLTDAIDPDALNNFVVSLQEKQDNPSGYVEFEYREHTITVTADGTITII